MSRTLLDHNGDVSREIITNEHEAPGVFHVKTSQDMEPLIDLVSTLRDVNSHVGHRKSRNMVPVAEIPMQVYERAAHEGWLNDKTRWRQWVNDPDNKALRITSGRF